MSAESHLRQMLEMKRRMDPERDWLEDWLLANGETFGPRVEIEGVELGPQKLCFMNSFEALFNGQVDRDEWFYTEGEVLLDYVPLSIHHAWLSNSRGEVLELTLRDPPASPAAYFGVPFKVGFALKQMLRQGHYGLFSDGIRYQPITRAPVDDARAWPKQERKAA